MHGAFNTTAPTPMLIKQLMQHIIKAKQPHAILLPVPPFALKLALGEMSEMLLNSQRCADEKILNDGYRFKFGEIGAALRNIIENVDK